MLHKIAFPFLCLALLLIPGLAGATTIEDGSHHAALTVEKTFRNDGLRFQVVISNRTVSEDEPSLFTIKTKVTNTSRKPIPYVQTVCADVRSTISVQLADKKLFLSPSDDLACPPVTQDKELSAGQTITQQEQFTTASLPSEDMSSQGPFTLRSSLLLGSTETEGKFISFETSFDDGISLPDSVLRVDATLTKKSNKYQLDVKGMTTVPQVKAMYLTVGKSNQYLSLNKKTQKLSLSKRITIKGNPPEGGILTIICTDGTSYTQDIPLQLS